MSRYNPEIHNRQSIRLKGYDYSLGGVYFITICSQNRENLFGDFINNKIVLNNAGKMIEKWVIETKNKFKNILIDQYVIMPNHLHCIISIETIKTETGEHVGSPLREIIQWFKTMSTNEYIRGVKDGKYPPFNKRIWQRNYYERIIRNENEFNQIAEYIVNNPINWMNDKNNLDITIIPVGADLRVCPNNEVGEHIIEMVDHIIGEGEHVGSPLRENIKENNIGEDDIERFEDKYGRVN